MLRVPSSLRVEQHQCDAGQVIEMLPSEHVMSPLARDEQILEVRGGYLEFLEIGLK